MINSCVVGLGAVGPIHARAAGDRLSAVCDVDKRRADCYAKKYNVTAYYDYESVLADERINTVHICTPHYLHKSMALAALEAGKNIVLEKPVGISLEEIDELERVYRKSDRKVCIMLQNRTNNSVAEMKRIIDEDKTLGKMRGIAAFMTWHRDEAYYASADWRGKWATEGGALLINQAIHIIDLLDWLGGGIAAVKSGISNKATPSIETEDTAEAVFEMKNGCRGVFYATNTFGADMPFRVEAVFENAVLRYADGHLYRIGKDVEIVTNDSKNIAGKECWGDGHSRVISKFYNAVESGTDDYMDLLSGIHSAKVMLSMYKNGLEKDGDWIII